MNISNMKNIVVLRNLPSNIVEEAIVVLKENKKIKKYQYVDSDNSRDANKKDKFQKNSNTKSKDSKEYVLREAEMVVSNYISNLETKSPKWKNNMKKLEKKYKNSLKWNFILGFSTIISIILSLV